MIIYLLRTYNLVVWKVKFVGKVEDKNGNEKLVRIIETPCLFVLEQDLWEKNYYLEWTYENMIMIQ